jgi:hypothetical protein
MFYFVRYTDSWADEMTIDGFSIMDEKEYEHYVATVNAIIADIESGLPFIYQVGSNEEIEYNNVDDFLSAFETSEFEEYPEGIEMVFGKKFPEFGFFPYGQMLDTLWDRANGLEVGDKELMEEYYRIDYYNSITKEHVGDPVYIKVRGYSEIEVDAQIESFEEHFATEYYKQYGVYVYPETGRIPEDLYNKEMNLNVND